MHYIPIPTRRPIQVGFRAGADGMTELLQGDPTIWCDTNPYGDLTVWNGHFTLTIIPEAEPMIMDMLTDYAAYWTHTDFPDPADGEEAWEFVARVFLDFLVVYVGDALDKDLLQVILRVEQLTGWVGDFIPAYAEEIVHIDEMIDRAYDEAKEGGWN